MRTSEQRGISPAITTLVLIVVALVSGGMVWVVTRSQASSLSGNVDVQVQSLDVVKAGGTGIASATVKNVGTVRIDIVDITISTDNVDYDITLSIGDLSTGQSGSADNDAFDETQISVGETYPVSIVVSAADGSTISRSMTVNVRSS